MVRHTSQCLTAGAVIAGVGRRRPTIEGEGMLPMGPGKAAKEYLGEHGPSVEKVSHSRCEGLP